MDNRVFKVGDYVRIRNWDDMEAEFGTNQFGIDSDVNFTRNMRYLCGEEFYITDIDEGGIVYGCGLSKGYYITIDMIEHLYMDNSDDGLDIDEECIDIYLSEINLIK